MNNTAPPGFSSVEKGFLPVAAVPCLVVFWLVYRYGKRRLAEEDTIEKRLEYFYSAISAALLGHLLFRIFPTISVQPFPALVGVGFFIILCVQKCARTWRDDPYSLLNDFNGELDYTVDRELVQIKTEMIEVDLMDPNISMNRKQVRMETDELKVRRKILALMFTTMVVTSIVEGFALAAEPQSVMVGMFYLARLAQTLTVATAMLHAFLHGMREGNLPWYGILSVAWCVVTALSTVPALVGYGLEIQDSVALMVLYSLSAGLLLWISLYFIFLDRRENSLRRTVVRLVIFGVVFVLTWIASFFI